VTDVPDAACYAVRPLQGRGWDTCDWQLGRFSPDGTSILAYGPGDGRGPRSLALLDARTGEVLHAYAARGPEDVFVHQAVWESSTAVLATVWDVDHWALLRLGLDGSRVSVGADGLEGADDPDAVPVVLAD
jgi:hypothetical protein